MAFCYDLQSHYHAVPRSDRQAVGAHPAVPAASSLHRKAASRRQSCNKRHTVRADERLQVDGHMPSRYGSHKTVWERHKKWSERGVWKRIMDSLVSHGYQAGLVDADDRSVDSSTIVAAKKGGKRLASTATRDSREARYMRQ